MTVLRAAVVRTEGESEMSPPVTRSLHATGGGGQIRSQDDQLSNIIIILFVSHKYLIHKCYTLISIAIIIFGLY